MKSIAVFCGSRMPQNETIKKEAIDLALYFVENNIKLVYGGAKIGIMGLIADTMLDHGGNVLGIMPTILASKEIMHDKLTEAITVSSMTERKQALLDHADAFIAFPGGCGTMDEIFEVITLNQIGSHDKRAGFINIDGYYDGIRHYLQRAQDEGFIGETDYQEIIFEDSLRGFMKHL